MTSTYELFWQLSKRAPLVIEPKALKPTNPIANEERTKLYILFFS